MQDLDLPPSDTGSRGPVFSAAAKCAWLASAVAALIVDEPANIGHGSSPQSRVCLLAGAGGTSFAPQLPGLP